jgi:hypothetical protein
MKELSCYFGEGDYEGRTSAVLYDEERKSFVINFRQKEDGKIMYDETRHVAWSESRAEDVAEDWVLGKLNNMWHRS